MIEAGIFGSRPNFEARFVPDHTELAALVECLKKAGLRIVLTQGTYDLIHDGHCEYLEKARAHGDLLIVGVDSDAKVKKRKGENRPIVPERERIRVLSYLRAVDIITIKQESDEHLELLKKIRPHVLIESASTNDRAFTEEKIRELEQYCGKVVILPPQSTNSTTARLRQIMLVSAEDLSNALAKEFPSFLAALRQKVTGEKE